MHIANRSARYVSIAVTMARGAAVAISLEEITLSGRCFPFSTAPPYRPLGGIFGGTSLEPQALKFLGFGVEPQYGHPYQPGFSTHLPLTWRDQDKVSVHRLH